MKYQDMINTVKKIESLSRNVNVGKVKVRRKKKQSCK